MEVPNMQKSSNSSDLLKSKLVEPSQINVVQQLCCCFGSSYHSSESISAYSTSFVSKAEEHVLITGGNQGIGLATALALARRTHTNGGLPRYSLTLACRNEKRAADAVITIQKECPGVSVNILRVDFASFQSVHGAIEEIRQCKLRFDTVILNAGVLLPQESITEDGLDTTLQVNFLAQYALIQSIIEYQRPNEQNPLKVITLTSVMYRLCGPLFRIPCSAEEWMNKFVENTNEKRNAWKAYSLSKLAMAMLAFSLNKHPGVHAVTIHPGSVHTGMTESIGTDPQKASLGKFRLKIRSAIQRHLLLTPEKSALNVLYCVENVKQFCPDQYRKVGQTTKLAKRVLSESRVNSLLEASIQQTQKMLISYMTV